MNAFSTFRGRRLLPFLAMCCLLAGLPMSAHAGQLTSRLTDGASLTPADSSVPGLAARVVYESQGENESQVSVPEINPHVALVAVALILVVPAGTAGTAPPPPPPLFTTKSTTDAPGGGHISGGPPPGGPSTNSTPEPGSLVLALTGSGTGLLVWLRRRRNAAMICHG